MGGGTHEAELREIRSLAAQHAEGSHEIRLRIREAQHEMVLAATPPIAFVHIPKTAGGSLKAMFARSSPRCGIARRGNRHASGDDQ
jgi:hypothetical protein